MPLYIKLLHLAFSAELEAVTPIIGILLIIGLVTAIFQSALHIEDATFSLLPKTIAMIILSMFGGFGALKVFENFAVLFISHATFLVRQTWS
jgi:flagellar biosynthesis protein FliQ